MMVNLHDVGEACRSKIDNLFLQPGVFANFRAPGKIFRVLPRNHSFDLHRVWVKWAIAPGLTTYSLHVYEHDLMR